MPYKYYFELSEGWFDGDDCDFEEIYNQITSDLIALENKETDLTEDEQVEYETLVIDARIVEKIKICNKYGRCIRSDDM